MKKAFAVLTALLLVAPEVGAHEGEPGHDHGLDEDDPTALPPPAAVDDDPDAADPGAPLNVESDGLPTEQQPPPAPPEPLVPPPESEVEANHGRSQTFPDTTWRRRIRENAPVEEDGWINPAHFYFEIRFGPYSPQVDEEPGLTGTPYADFFGDSPLFYFGLELDWLPLYIPYVASVGPAFGWGFTRASGKTRLESNFATEADSDTDLTIFPMHVSAAVRFDGLLREAQVPIVPYGKVGLGFGLWSVSGPGDNSVEGVSSEGMSTGLHAAVGGALALNAFDPSTAMSMHETTGIRYAYLYGEWMGDFLGSLGGEGQMYVGTSTVVVGLAAEF